MTDDFAFIYLHKQKVTLNGHTFVKRAPICLSPTNTTAQASRSSIGVLETWIKPPRKKRLSTVSSMGAALAAAEAARMTKVAALATTQHSLLERKVCVVCACVFVPSSRLFPPFLLLSLLYLSHRLPSTCVLQRTN